VASINVSSGNPYDRTNLIVGLRFRGLRGPVDQPGTQRVRAGRRSPAWQVILDPECGKALTLLRRAAGSNPARSTTKRFWREVRVGPGGSEKNHYIRFKNPFQVPSSRVVSRTLFQRAISGTRIQGCDSERRFENAIQNRIPRVRSRMLFGMIRFSTFLKPPAVGQ